MFPVAGTTDGAIGSAIDSGAGLTADATRDRPEPERSTIHPAALALCGRHQLVGRVCVASPGGKTLRQLALLLGLFVLERQVVRIQGALGPGHRSHGRPRIRGRSVQLRQGDMPVILVGHVHPRCVQH